jgi:hypothetical protein
MLVVALTSTQIEYSRELREYSLTFLAATLMLALFVRTVRLPTWKNVALMTSAMVFGISLQYGLTLLLISLNLVFVFELWRARDNRKRLALAWAVSQAVALCAAGAVYLASLRHQWEPGFAGSGGAHLAGTYGEGTVRSVLHLAAFNTMDLLRFAFPGSFTLPLLVFVIVVGLVWALRNAPASQGCTGILMMAVPLLVTLAAASATLYPFGGIRQDMFLLPMLFAYVGFGYGHLLEFTRRSWIIPVFTILVLIGTIDPVVAALKSSGDEDLRPIASMLSASFRAGDGIYVYYGAAPGFRYYYRENSDAQVYGTSNRGYPRKYFTELSNLLASKSRLWMVFSHCYADECEVIPDHLAASHTVELMATGRDTALYLVR